ncbi:hypothetical protein CBS101457_006298 [Exobasidium rhododendri]|nr:hypothetical protein CBS101457_006298 [Exobasidium rhododendri]
MRRHSLFSYLLFSALFCVTLTQAAGQACSSASQCPASSPCCGQGGTCGSGALQCAGGCQPLSSHSVNSCLPNPVCSNKNITFSPSDYKNANMFRPILLYDGDSSKAPFTLDYGFLGAGPEGVLLELTAPTQTKLSTTDYILYGNIELVARHNALQGLVFTMITMSDIKDEIDWEFTTSDGSDAFTNYFSQGLTVKGSSATIKGASSFDVSDWHTYGLNWQADSLQWSIDGKVVKTIKSASVGTQYPNSPSRVQISTWAGGNATNPAGTVAWAGGAIDWTSANYTSQGYYSAEIKSFAVTCGSQNVTGVSSTGSGSNVTSWVYTGTTSSTFDAPAFALSTTPITFLSSPSEDAVVGLPGYTVQSDFTQTNKNAWDGSGNTSGLSTKAATAKSSTQSSTQGSTKSSTKSSTLSSTNSGHYWLNNSKTLSIAVPVVAAAVGIIVLWAIVVCCVKRRRRANEVRGSKGFGDTSAFSVGPSNGARTTVRQTSLYKQLDDEEEDLAPVGAQRIGAGYGPAVGPSPGKINGRGYTDSVSSLHDTRGYTASSDDLGQGAEGYGERTTNQYSRTDVRRPYTLAKNAYTPAARQAQAPAMRQAAPLNSSHGVRQTEYSNYATPNSQSRPAPQYQAAHTPHYKTYTQTRSAYPQQQPYNPQPQSSYRNY